MKKKIKNFLIKYLKNKNKNEKNLNKYSLQEDAFSNEDILVALDVLLSKKITMGEITKKFENEFAKYLNVKHALMVNSGSSANLLAAFALVNPMKKNHLKKNDEFIIQALCWSTSLWPLVQAGLKPKFIDVNLDSFNIDYKELENNINKKTKAIMAVHVLGNSSDISKISNLCKKNNIYLIEDTCESLGSKFKNKFLGTYGDFGTYSFYYSHQITSGEGGMIVCHTNDDYRLLHSLRSHGWDRGFNPKIKNQIKENTFNFINSGFNLRPLDITAAIGLNQFRRLNKFMDIRSKNRTKIIKFLKSSEKWKNQFKFFYEIKNLEPSWFGFPLVINENLIHKKEKFLNYLKKQNIETRPILSGNFMNQKSIKLYGLNKEKINFKNAQTIEDRGFFIGLHTNLITKSSLSYLTNHLLMIDRL